MARRLHDAVGTWWENSRVRPHLRRRPARPRRPWCPAGAARRPVGAGRPARPPRLRAGHLPGAVLVDLDTETSPVPPGPPAASVARARAGPRRMRRPVFAPAVRSSPTTTPTPRSPRGRGGCCAGLGHDEYGCSTAGSRLARGRLPGCRSPHPPDARRLRRYALVACPSSTPTAQPPGLRGAVCCSTPARESATAAKPNPSTRVPATSPVRSALRPAKSSRNRRSVPGSGRPAGALRGSRRRQSGRGVSAGPGSPPRTRSRRSPSRGSTPRCIRVVVGVVERPRPPRRHRRLAHRHRRLADRHRRLELPTAIGA